MSFDSFHLAWKENDFLGRYLISLRCSYSSQFQNGLLAPLAYRQVSVYVSVYVSVSVSVSVSAHRSIHPPCNARGLPE